MEVGKNNVTGDESVKYGPGGSNVVAGSSNNKRHSGTGDWRRTKKKQSRKNQIRSVERSLQRDNIAPEMKASLLAKLDELRKAVTHKEKQDIEKKRSKRYHKVKFFEKQKVTRRLESARKKLDAIEKARSLVTGDAKSKKRKHTGTGETLMKAACESSAADFTNGMDEKSVREEIKRLEDDLTYIKYFPRDKKYLSLFSSRDVPDERTKKKQEELRTMARVARDAEEKGGRRGKEAKKAKRQKTKEGGPRSVGDEDDEGTSENKDKGVAVDEEDAGFFLSDDDSA